MCPTLSLNVGRALLVCSLPCHATARNRDSQIHVSSAPLCRTAPSSEQTVATAPPGTVSGRLGCVLVRTTIPTCASPVTKGQRSWLCRPRPLLWVLNEAFSRARDRLEGAGFGTHPTRAPSGNVSGNPRAWRPSESWFMLKKTKKYSVWSQYRCRVSLFQIWASDSNGEIPKLLHLHGIKFRRGCLFLYETPCVCFAQSGWRNSPCSWTQQNVGKKWAGVT